MAIFKVYARAIFKELNEYRKDNGFEPYIKWLPNLVETSKYYYNIQLIFNIFISNTWSLKHCRLRKFWLAYKIS